MRTPATRRQHGRAGRAGRHRSHLTGARWAVLAPFGHRSPDAAVDVLTPRRRSSTRSADVLRGLDRLAVDSRYGARPTGGSPGCSMTGRGNPCNHQLVMCDRAGRGVSPTAAVVDSQRLQTAESGGVRGHDAGQKVKGRQRHTLVDTDDRAFSGKPTRRTSRTLTGPCRCCGPPARSCHSCNWPMRMGIVTACAWPLPSDSTSPPRLRNTLGSS